MIRAGEASMSAPVQKKENVDESQRYAPQRTREWSPPPAEPLVPASSVPREAGQLPRTPPSLWPPKSAGASPMSPYIGRSAERRQSKAEAMVRPDATLATRMPQGLGGPNIPPPEW